MNLLPNRHAHTATVDSTPKQFVTLAVAAPHEPLESELMRALLARTPGVETIAVDADSGRVWVFGDGTVEPEDLVGALAWWGYGARVLNHQLNRLE